MTFKVLVATRSFGSTSQAPWDVLKDDRVECTQVDMSQEVTENMIGRDKLARMKRTALLVNTSRGSLVDEEALHQALVKKQIAGAALNTFVNEPPTGSPLLTLKNVVVTSHIGAHTREAIERVGVTAALNVVRTLQGGQPLHRVSA